MNDNNKQLAIQKSLQPIAVEAMSLKVKSHGDLLVATDLLSRLNQINDRIEEEKQKVLAPLNKARTAEIARWKPVLGFYEDAINHIREQMSSYQTAIVSKQKAKEQIIADKLSDGTIGLEEAVAKIEKIKTPEKNIVGKDGDVQFRETKKFEVMEPAMIFAKIVTDYHGEAKVVSIDYNALAKYFIINETAIKQALKEGVELPGVRYYTEMVPVNYR